VTFVYLRVVLQYSSVGVTRASRDEKLDTEVQGGGTEVRGGKNLTAGVGNPPIGIGSAR